MYCYKILLVRNSIVLPVLIGLSVLATPAKASLSLGVEASVAQWEGKTAASAFEDEGGDVAVGGNLKIQIYKMFAGIEFLSGKYKFDKQPANDSVIANGVADVTRRETNTTIGYYLFDNLSLFAKYKSLKFDASNSYHFKNPGVGSQVHWTLSSNWLLFANIALFEGDVHLDGKNSGDSSVTEYMYGVVFRPTLHTHFILSSRFQELDIEMTDSGEETHEFSGGYLSYNYIF